MNGFFKSVLYAVRGLSYVVLHEKNFRVQLILTLGWLVLTVCLRLAFPEILTIVFVQTVILSFEIANSAVELLLDVVKPRLSAHIAMVKNMLAAMVLLVGVVGHVLTASLLFPLLIERLH
jgi:diacylglycerol kinase